MSTVKTWQERTHDDNWRSMTVDYMQAEIDELRAENTNLRTAAQAVIDRWDTPLWKDVPATAVFIGRLRAALGETP